MIRHDEDSNLSAGTCYTLYLEYLGGLVPLLKGKRTSKIRPEFVIFDPQVEGIFLILYYMPQIKYYFFAESLFLGEAAKSRLQTNSAETSPNGRFASESSDSDRDDGCASPRVQMRRKRRCRSQERDPMLDLDDLTYVDTLPEVLDHFFINLV